MVRKTLFNKRILRILICSSLFVLSACSGVKIQNSSQRGLFQSGKPETLTVSDKTNFDSMDASFYGLKWPIKEGSITSFFGNRKRDYHEGLDIKAFKGTPIYAAKDGVVIYSSRRIKGYGNMIVLKHDHSLSTVYAHNKMNVATKGQKVAQGQLIAYVGATGKATGPHLHFEVRRKEVPMDPLLYLPQLRAVASSKTSN